MGRDRGMAVGAFVVLGASFQPWFSTRVGDGLGGVLVQSKNAWLASSRWSVAVVGGLVATLVWFGVARRLTGRGRAAVAAALLFGAVGLVGQVWWRMHESGGPTVVIVRYFNASDSGFMPVSEMPAEGTIERDTLAVRHTDGYTADLEPAHYVAWAALLGMLLIAVTGFVREPVG